MCERCYWEIEWSESVEISVSYKSISRKEEVMSVCLDVMISPGV